MITSIDADKAFEQIQNQFVTITQHSPSFFFVQDSLCM